MKTALLASEAASLRRRIVRRRRIGAAIPLLLLPLLWFVRPAPDDEVPEVAVTPEPAPYTALLDLLAHAGPIIVTFPDGRQDLLITRPEE